MRALSQGHGFLGSVCHKDRLTVPVALAHLVLHFLVWKQFPERPS